MQTHHAAGLSITTPFLTWFGGAMTLLGIVVGALAVGSSWLGAFVSITMFGCGGLALLLMGGRVTGNEDGLEIARLHTRRFVHWRDVVGVERGGGNLVLMLSAGGRVVGPDTEFWVGSDKRALLALIGSKLAEAGIQPKVRVRAVFSAGDRR